MKKLLIYNTSLARGGAERVTVYLADYMVKHGIPCDIVTDRFEQSEYDVPDGVTRICLGKGYFNRIKKFRRTIKESGADTLLIMGVSNCICGIPAALGQKLRVVVSERNDPAHFMGKTVVKHVSRFLMKFADGFVFQTEDAKAYYAKSLKNRGTIIPNPLFTDNLPDVYTGVRKKQLVNIGRLHRQKNQTMLIDAFASIANEHPDFDLVIFGKGGLQGELEELITSKGMEQRIKLAGNSPRVQQDIQDCYGFVLSSDFEGMPNALIEAMALGLPCISTDCPCGGPRSLIEDRKNGILIPVGDTEALAHAMDEIIRDEAFAKSLGENAVTIRKRLDSAIIGKRWLDYLGSL